MYEFYILNDISDGDFKDEVSRLNHLKDEKRTTGTIKLDDIMNRMWFYVKQVHIILMNLSNWVFAKF